VPTGGRQPRQLLPARGSSGAGRRGNGGEGDQIPEAAAKAGMAGVAVPTAASLLRGGTA